MSIIFVVASRIKFLSISDISATLWTSGKSCCSCGTKPSGNGLPHAAGPFFRYAWPSSNLRISAAIYINTSTALLPNGIGILVAFSSCLISITRCC